MQKYTQEIDGFHPTIKCIRRCCLQHFSWFGSQFKSVNSNCLCCLVVSDQGANNDLPSVLPGVVLHAHKLCWDEVGVNTFWEHGFNQMDETDLPFASDTHRCIKHGDVRAGGVWSILPLTEEDMHDKRGAPIRQREFSQTTKLKLNRLSTSHQVNTSTLNPEDWTQALLITSG